MVVIRLRGGSGRCDRPVHLTSSTEQREEHGVRQVGQIEAEEADRLRLYRHKQDRAAAVAVRLAGGAKSIRQRQPSERSSLPAGRYAATVAAASAAA